MQTTLETSVHKTTFMCYPQYIKMPPPKRYWKGGTSGNIASGAASSLTFDLVILADELTVLVQEAHRRACK